MEYAIQIFLPVLGGLLLGDWLCKQFGLNPIWTVLLGILGLIGGIGVLYKRFTVDHSYPKFTPKAKTDLPPGKSVQDLDSLYKKIHEEPADDSDYPDFDQDPFGLDWKASDDQSAAAPQCPQPKPNDHDTEPPTP